MKFLAFAIMAIVFIPIVMLLQKGLGHITNDKQVKEDMKKGNKDLGRAWIMFIVVIGIVILFALLTSCNGRLKFLKQYDVNVSLDSANKSLSRENDSLKLVVEKGKNYNNTSFSGQVQSTQSSTNSNTISDNVTTRTYSPKELNKVKDGLDGDVVQLYAFNSESYDVTVFFEIWYQSDNSARKKVEYTKPIEYANWNKDIRQRAKDDAMDLFTDSHSYQDKIISIQTYTYSEYWKGSQAYHSMRDEVY